MVAKSYAGLKQICDPYPKNGKQYVLVQMANGSQKEVRWYTEKEYARLYPASAAKASSSSEWDYEKGLGFAAKGYILIFHGGDEEFFEKNKVFRYHRLWGWYVVGEEEQQVPPLPADVHSIPLYWNRVGKGNQLLSDEAIQKVLLEII